jgi:hypothetical protein
MDEAITPLPNWITYASCWNNTGFPLENFVSTWKVPEAPLNGAAQLLYFFNGIETHDGMTIIQPVLQWGDSGPDAEGNNLTGPF